jgi:polyketide cyclase/dehydrase/lipid transport protein
VSAARQQVLIESPLERVWELLGDPKHHPEWWPRVVEVSGDSFDQGGTYKQVTSVPTGRHETTQVIERLEDLHAIHTRCLDTGMYARWQVTGAQTGTYLEVEMGMDPEGATDRFLYATVGKPFFRRWLRQSIDALQAAAEGR